MINSGSIQEWAHGSHSSQMSNNSNSRLELDFSIVNCDFDIVDGEFDILHFLDCEFWYFGLWIVIDPSVRKWEIGCYVNRPITAAAAAVAVGGEEAINSK